MQNNYNLNDAETLIKIILKDLKDKNYVGLDPSAIRFSNRLLKIISIAEKILPFKFGRKIVYKTLFLTRDKFVELLKPQKQSYAKGMGLVLSSYVNLKREDLISEEDFRESVNRILNIIKNKKLERQYLWAHEINYRIIDKEITTSTPNLITTAFVAFGIYDLATYTNEEKYKKLFINIIKDMLETFPLTPVNSDEACFMYTPTTDYFVHNSNLIMAELLVKYQELKYDSNIDIKIFQSLMYSLNEFEKTNSFYYSGEPTLNKSIDNYHTGYVLRSLKAIYRYINNDFNNIPSTESLLKRLKKRLEFGLNFYVENFVDKGLIIRDHFKTLETHSLAESIIFLEEFKEYLSEEKKSIIQDAINNTIPLLWDTKNNHFIYVARLKGTKYKTDSTYMVRWSQSWMAYALSLTVEKV